MSVSTKRKQESAESSDKVWSALPGSQTLFLRSPVRETLFGGTRGPGKTDAMLWAYGRHVGKGYGRRWAGLIFRRKFKDLKDIVSRSKEWFYQAFPGARFLDSASSYYWRFPGGETLSFRQASDENDYWDYHGGEYPFIGLEEMTTWPDLTFYDAMKSVCRSTDPNMPRMMRGTANPWGVGHSVVKARFIDPAPPLQIINDKYGERVYIPGYWWENPHLRVNDPAYIHMLETLTDENKKKAWYYGDWNIVAGGMFSDVWDERVHVVEPFVIPHGWRIDRAFDWGSSAPFSVGWWAESDGTDYFTADGIGRSTVKGDLFRIDEWYGWNGEANEGLRLTDQKIAEGVLERDAKWQGRVRAGPADTSIFDVVNGESTADRMSKAGVHWTRASKGPGSRVAGWGSARSMLENATERNGLPGLYIFNTCRNFIRTVPILPRDAKNMDDADSEAEDHIADEMRYRLHRGTGSKSGKRKLGGL